MPPPTRSWITRWTAVLAIAAGLTVATGWYASGLRIDSRLVALLPDDLAAAEEYRRFLDVFGGFEKVFITIENDGPGTAEDLTDAAGLLAERLRESELISHVRSGFDDTDEAFFVRYVLPRAPLLIDREPQDIGDPRLDSAAIRIRVGTLRAQLSSPFGALSESLLVADPFGFAGELGSPGSQHSDLGVDPFSGAFLSRNQNVALVIATPTSAELDSDAGHALLGTLDRAFQYVRAETGSSFTFRAIGGPLYAAQDESIIRADLVRTITGSIVGIGLLLILYFMGVRIPLALSLGVSAGILWIAGLTAIVQGSISVIGISFSSILLGLGVDYGIHGASRYQHISMQGSDRRSAMLQSFRETGPAISASVATTVAVFLLLALAQFRPVRELGLLVAFGILAVLATSMTIGAPLVVLLPSRSLSRRTAPTTGLLWRSVGRSVDGLVSWAQRYPRFVVWTAVLLTLLASAAIPNLQFSADFRSLRPENHPAGPAEEILTTEFGLGLDTFTIVLEGTNLGNALDQAARVKHLLQQRFRGEAVDVSSPSDWLVAGNTLETRLKAWSGEPLTGALNSLTEELDRQGFAVEAFASTLGTLRTIAEGQAPPPIPRQAWPDWLEDLIRIEADAVQVAVRVRTPSGMWPDGPPAELVTQIKDEVPSAAIASIPRLGIELRRLVASEFRRLGKWCLLAVTGIILLSFRGRVRYLVLSLLPVLMGCCWLLGYCGAAGVVITPISLSVAPVLLGIGVDDGLHALHGSDVHGGLAASMRKVGTAMTLTTMTTFVGFGSLVFSRVPALRSSGLLVASGTLLCLLTTLLLLPALDTILGRRRRDASR